MNNMNNYFLKQFTPFSKHLGRSQKLPEERRYVLVYSPANILTWPSAIVVGYLKYHAGNKDVPYFVIPGHDGQPVTYWSDCLGEEFQNICYY